MPVYKDDKRGTWYCKIRYTDWQGNRKETTKRGFTTKRDAKEYETEYLNKMAGSADMTLQSLFDIYIEDRQHKIKESSLIGITTSMSKHVLPHLGKMPLSKITPNVIRKWQNQLEKATNKQGNKLAPPTLLNINRRFAAVLNFGVKYYGMQRNPMTITGTQGATAKRIDFWSKEEFEQFLEAVDHPTYKTLYLLLFYSGMRVGEALALTESDIDFETGKVHITKTYTATGHVTAPKTKSSVRYINLPMSVSRAVQGEYERLAYDVERIFPVSYQDARYHFSKAVKKSGVRRLTIHSLRHAHASILIAKGVPITAISKRLGHTSPKVTLSIYSHSMAGSDEEIAKILDNF